jgi:hypothetical protein
MRVGIQWVMGFGEGRRRSYCAHEEAFIAFQEAEMEELLGLLDGP